jgi:5'-3' exoribonuclease 1
LTKKQQRLLQAVQAAVLAHRDGNWDSTQPVTFVNDLSAGDKKFITNLASDLNLTLTWDEFDDYDQNIVSLYFPEKRVSSTRLMGEAAPDAEDSDDENAEDQWEDTSSEDEVQAAESTAAIDRVLNKYNRASLLDDTEDDNFEVREAQRLQEKIDDWKKGYYQVSSEYGTYRPTLTLVIVSRKN